MPDFDFFWNVNDPNIGANQHRIHYAESIAPMAQSKFENT